MHTRYWLLMGLLFIMEIPCVGTIQGAENKARPQDPFIFEKNVAIPTDDGSLVMANVYRPKDMGRYPVIMSMSVYGKDLGLTSKSHWCPPRSDDIQAISAIG